MSLWAENANSISGSCRARSRTSSARISCNGTCPSAIGRSRLSMLRLMLCRCSMIASMSRTRAVILRATCSGSSAAAVAIEPALALRPNRIGAASSCRFGAGPGPLVARADFVVQLERSAAPLVVLGRDQPMVELLVLAAGGVERLRERIEAVGDGGKLLRAGSWQPYPKVALLEVGEAAGDAGERVKHPSEQEIKNGNDGAVHAQRHRAERDGIAPDLRDLVARLRNDLDRADARPIDHD